MTANQLLGVIESRPVSPFVLICDALASISLENS